MLLLWLALTACGSSDGVILAEADGRANADVSALIGATCGDGVCLGRETILNCPVDCAAGYGPARGGCGDGQCQVEETGESCPLDCVTTCGDAFCLHGEIAQTCPVDCPAICGDGACTGIEDNAACPADCKSFFCGDAFCLQGETAETCPADCPAVCGDGACTGSETPAGCAQDCGNLETEGPVCGDGDCAGDEDSVSCVQDCGAICGDEVCNGSETASICPKDCDDGGEVGEDTVASGDTIHLFSKEWQRWCGANQAGEHRMKCNEEGPGWLEKFEVHKASGDGPLESGDTIHFFSNGSQLWCAAETGGDHPMNCNRSVPGAWEKFVIFKASGVGQIESGDTIHLFSKEWQLWCTAEQTENHPMSCGKPSAEAWEKFTIEKAGSGAPPPGSICGDDACNGAETPDTCAEDCGPPNGDIPQWTFHGVVAGGEQSDAVRGPENRVHLIADRYYQFDMDAAKVVDEDEGDGHTGPMSFPPAIAVGDDGSVHLVTRHDGDWYGGYNIRYRRRNANGDWDQDYIFGSKVARNYVVGVAYAGPGEVYMGHSQAGDGVWGDLHIWKAGDGSGSQVGTLDGIWRADADSRMRGLPGRVFLVSGKPDPGGKAYTLHGDVGGNLVGNLNANKTTHSAGSGRTGFTDLAVDGAHNVHVTYGAYQAVYYNQFTESGQKVFGGDKEIFNGLNEWHLSAGLSAVGASGDGTKVLAVALRSDGGETASNSDLLWAYSTDGGANWSAPQDTGHNTVGGEGRCRPRVVAIGNKFFVFYRDKSDKGISLATLSL